MELHKERHLAGDPSRRRAGRGRRSRAIVAPPTTKETS
jgi:hypothetical protein